MEICPKHCIRMIEDAKGFIYPQVDSAICVECGACDKVCPMNVSNISLKYPLKALAAWNKTDKNIWQVLPVEQHMYFHHIF